jgi:murein DD-endopeptidase MepM/ murein hydrolase activator NlpD
LVKKWETLSQISIDYQIKIASLLLENSNINPWKPLKIGTKLKILPVDWISVKTAKNISVREIAKIYKIDEKLIRKQNNISEDVLILKKWKELIIPWWKKEKVIKLSNKDSKLLLWKSNFSYSFSTSSYLIRPAKGVITQYFTLVHHWLDIADANRWPIFASADWVVVKARKSWWNWWYWKVIVVDHGKWLKTLYAHNQKIYVKIGQTVKQWDVIWWMWNSWRVRWRTWIHIHFEVISGGKKVNPLYYIR